MEPAYNAWPKQTFTSVKTPPGDGGDVSISMNIAGAPPLPVDQNPAWQAWNKALNVKLNMQLYPFADLATKFGTLIAGGDLPDIIHTLTRQDIPLTPELMEAKAQDLTPFLSGDAIKDYPNLAALPTRSWYGVIFNNKIFGVPVPTPQGPFFWWPLIHQELLDAQSIQQPKTTDDYQKMMVALTKPQQNVWGSINAGGYQYSYDMNTGNGWYPSMFGAPNLWAVDKSSGKFTHMWETDNYKQALDYTIGLFKAGIFHPDSPSLNVVSGQQYFEGRKGAFVDSGFSPVYWDIRGTPAVGLNPPNNINLLTPPAANGFKPQYYNGRPAFAIAFFKKAPDARIKMLLKLLDYIAAPFGSDEYLLINYGVKDRDWTYDDKGNPNTTKDAQTDFGAPASWLATLTGRYQVLAGTGGDPDYGKRTQGFQKILAPMAVEDASLGLFSPTQASKGVPLIQPFGDGITDIVAGRRPASDLPSLIDGWKKAGGDQVRAEFEKAYAATK
ncbi:MAG TPA: hypothetical protein VFS62_14935 [Chloroflexota bacterium]|nr:hypothetical protein [Chloroflexota bacterium]